jgi:glutamyl-tRNA synthetase
MSVVTRFAPSPTGFLHIGGVRTALYNWLYARKNGGKFLLRIEDTDRARHKDASVDQILESLEWVGINWDNDELVFQSKRQDIYKKYFEQLKRSGYIYPAFETQEELEAMRQKAMAEKRPAVYDRSALELSEDERQSKIDAGIPHVWRFKVPDGDTVVPDLLMGGDECRFSNAQVGDFAITRPSAAGEDIQVLYNFVVTVDDALMDITHVIRGVEHLGNAAKQTILYNALGFDVPQFCHLPLIMKAGKKMSKRDEDADPRFPVSTTARRDLGYLPEATVNYLALLGWSSPDENELLQVEDLIKNFSLDRLSKSNANFDEDKYLHINGWHIRNIENDDLVSRLKPYLDNAELDTNAPWLASAVELVKERCNLLFEFVDALSYFYKAPREFEEKGVNKFFKTDISVKILTTVADRLEGLSDFSIDAINAELHKIVEELELKFGKFGPVIRLALTGRMQSPGLAEVMSILGKEESASRLRFAANFIADNNLMTAA